MNRRNWVLAAALLVAAVVPGRAAVIYNNGAPNQASGNEMTSWIQAEDFTLGAASTVTGVRFWSIEDAPGAFDGSITWHIYGDSAGIPGALLASGTGGSLSRVATGVVGLFGSLDEYQYDFTITPTALAGGTVYWLGLHNGPLTTTARREMYWETTGGPNGVSFGKEDVDPFGAGGWFGNGQEHAFMLFDDAAAGVVPEPGTLALLGFGVVPMLRRRKR